jgi:ribosomal protein S18 acetylase RimI-like enzyme
VGAEHCVLGCAAMVRLSSDSQVVYEHKPLPLQLSLLAVRKSCRKMGIGRHLMQVHAYMTIQCVIT